MSDLFIGSNNVKSDKHLAFGQFIQIGDEKFYQILNFDSIPPFFISLASDSNHWMYISSTGGLTAGRKNPDQALFPYYTDDKIHESAESTGSKTILHVIINGKRFLWEPFSDRYQGVYQIERTISKSTAGNKLTFGEKNLDLGLSFFYEWMNSDKFGWVKKSWLINDTNQPTEVFIVDGLQNILPFGVSQQTQNTFSTLVDAYKKCELIQEANLALFRMESIMVDRAEPSEALKVTTIWNHGLENASFLLSSKQLDRFREGFSITPEVESKGVRGAFFAYSNLVLEASANKIWYFVAELSQDSAKVNNLIDFIQREKNLANAIESDVAKGTKSLMAIVQQADGIQHTADENENARHFSNVLFNTMRGGYFSDGYLINSSKFCKHIQHFNHNVWSRNKVFLETLPESILYSELGDIIQKQNDSNLYRLYLEYLPLTFSRRHGDPSRPWNLFNINVKDDDGNKILAYQGNWRDIFQNWEALSYTYPGYINGIIAKFLNASTADGYNPYKVTSEGIDWEVIEHDNPWSNIGYWGDHQIIYLLKLLEVSRNYYPKDLLSWLDKDLFTYANVPYRIKSYPEIVSDPKNSIHFDETLNQSIEKLIVNFGKDAKLILNPDKEVMLVSFTEKILVTLLTKLSNFIPEAGIWMNTLRPEWNDANNALVGNGASMVTLYYMRRFVAFTIELYQDFYLDKFILSDEVACFFEDIDGSFNKYQINLEKGFNNHLRKELTDELGIAGSNYRDKIYQGFSGRKRSVSKKEFIDFLELTLKYIDQSIDANKRDDKMYHAYNLVSFTEDAISIRYLYEMLEGQVAVLSSGKLNVNQSLDLLNSLRNSSLYRPDQNSYILYPNKQLPQFLNKNLIPAEDVKRIKILSELVEKGDLSILVKDSKGLYHFNADFSNAMFLKEALDRLKTKSNLDIAEEEQKQILDLYEKIFDHQSFTGRSGSFYKYEGLGSIYWHMVSKLLLSIGESIKTAELQHADTEILGQLIQQYREVKNGIGAHKSPKEYGSFPFDPYSHTPLMSGVQQPGMTGQVKEDIISRFFELGIFVSKGQLSIRPMVLRKAEFVEPKGKSDDFQIPWLSFTFCSVNILYLLDSNQGMDILFLNDEVMRIPNYYIPESLSQSIFLRQGRIQKIVVHINPDLLKD